MPKKPAPGSGSPEARRVRRRFELEVVPGLERVAQAELASTTGVRIVPGTLKMGGRPGSIQAEVHGDWQLLLGMRTVLAVYEALWFAVPRPKALLGDENFRNLRIAIESLLAESPPGAYRTLFISAAGRRSAVLVRLQETLAQALLLTPATEAGDVLLRLRRPLHRPDGWEVLLRLGPRPLSTRDWRVQNFPGALNATVAHAMAQLTEAGAGDCVLNLACGSGSLIIEHLQAHPGVELLGVDNDPFALDCASQNLAASGHRARWTLLQADGRQLPLVDRSFSAVTADLPFGGLVGSHAMNVSVYPQLLAEAARVSRAGARFILITHEIRLTKRLLAGTPYWRALEEWPITLGGLHPRIFILQRGEND